MKYFYYQHIPKFILYQSVCCIFLLSKLPLESSTFNGNDPGYVLQDNIDLEIVLVCALYNSTRIFVSFHFVVIVVGVFFLIKSFDLSSLIQFLLAALIWIFLSKKREINENFSFWDWNELIKCDSEYFCVAYLSSEIGLE